MAHDFDLIVIGGGPAGYAAAIRAAQLGKKALCVEKDKLGGICLNWGCIPTKALLTNAHLVELIEHHGDGFGWSGKSSWDFPKMIRRSRDVTTKMNRGIQGLFKKYKVQHKQGEGKIVGPNQVRVGDETLSAGAILIATGVHPKALPGTPFDGKRVISYKEAMSLDAQPKSLLVIGAGAIGCEFAYFYNAIGTEVTIVEMMDQLLPIEDEEVSKTLRKSFEKRGMTVWTGSKTTKLEPGKNGVKAELETPKGTQKLETEAVLVAIGVAGNIKGLWDESKVKIETEKGHIKVDPKNGYVTATPSIFAVGDVIGPPWLAHVAHHEAICCVERHFGAADRTVDYDNIPGCTYTVPGVASVGLTEAKARESGRSIRIGKFPFMASGRAVASDETEGFVKLIFDADLGELLGAHIIGTQATEMIAELVLAKKLEATEEEIYHAMHPHPTFSESIMEAAGQGLGSSVHL